MAKAHKFVSTFAGIALMCASASYARAEHLTQSSTEVRTYVWLKANADAVQNSLPKGWTVNPPSGFLKDANVAVVLIDGIAASDAEGKPVPFHDKYAVVALPAKNEQTGMAAFMIVSGFIQPSKAPGPYGVYKPASVTVSKKSQADGVRPELVDEQWNFTSETGEKLHFSVTYTRGTGTKRSAESRVYSALKPDFFRIYKVDQVSDTVYPAEKADKIRENMKFSAEGPEIAKLFDGREQIVAIVSVPSYYRQIFLPD